MSSATKSDGTKVRGMIQGLPDSEYANGPTDTLSQRQKDLDWYWRFYRCSNYDECKVDWNGQGNVPQEEHAQIARGGVVPPGFYEGGQMMPLKFRKPLAPYYLARVIVKRFTNLLFSSRRHPKIQCDDESTEDWLTGFAEATRLWSRMAQARIYGGAMGAVGISFKFVEGKPHVEVHDPRWCDPEFEDRITQVVSQLEKRYQYPLDVRNPDGDYEVQWFWYRRVITDMDDTVWPKVRVKNAEEPNWPAERHTTVVHGFGRCPVVWMQNCPVEDAVDGDPDCHGVYDLIQDIDQLYSQASKGTKSNCDPTVALSSDAEFDEIQKGSGMAIQTEKGGSVEYLEMTGAGVDRAITIAEKLEEKALTIACCMLDRNEGGPSRTTEEVEANYSAMIEQADTLREQYGEMGVKRLLEMVLEVARNLTTPTTQQQGNVRSIVRNTITLPKRKNTDPETGKVTWETRVLGTGEQIDLQWPDYFQPSAAAMLQRVEAAGKAKQYKLIDSKTGTQYVASGFQIEDVPETLDKLKVEAEEEAAALQETMQARSADWAAGG